MAALGVSTYVISASTTLSSIPVGATTAVVQAISGDVWWTDDGTDPAESSGALRLSGGVERRFSDTAPSALRFASAEPNSAPVRLGVAYYSAL